MDANPEASTANVAPIVEETISKSEMTKESDDVKPSESMNVETEASVTHAPSSEEEDNVRVVVIEEEVGSPTGEKFNKNAAPIFNRFSNWRQKANENATALWKKQKEQMQATVAANPGLFNGRQSDAVPPASSVESDPSMETEQSSASEPERPSEPRRSLQWSAATSMVENVQAGYFRGRYNKDEDKKEKPVVVVPDTEPTNTQTSRILLSPQAKHLEELQKKIAPHEYIMLLGRGMLGVNLKQPFMKNQGVYVDFLVKGGAADDSKVICIGDVLVSIGDLNTTKGTILTVPKAIADAKRPVHLVLSTPGAISSQIRINYVDISVALVHVYGNPTEPLQTEQEPDSVDGTSPVIELVQPASFDQGEDSTSVSNVPIPKYDATSHRAFVSPSAPSVGIREAFESQVAKRSNSAHFGVDELVRSAADHEDLRNAVEHAFILCATDGRRFPFLTRHLSTLSSLPESSSETLPPTNALLMLFLEMARFAELYHVTPVSRRKVIAQGIATKFFLPTQIDNDLVPPAMDFHHIVPDLCLRKLEAALESTDISVTIFREFQEATVSRLSEGPFMSFLVSDECARMRAFLRNTAPFVSIPVEQIFGSVVAGNNHQTKNYLCYVLIYLLCHREKDGIGECDEVFGSEGPRVQDAASGICASFYLQRELLPLCARVKAGKKDDDVLDSLLEAYEQLWMVFLSPGIGALEHSSLTSETEDLVDEVQRILQELGLDFRSRSGDTAAKEALLVELVDDQLVKLLENLSYDCMYDYAVNFHSKFREHKFHEWLCAEISKAQDPATLNEDFQLPAGCVKRLLRKTEFPSGVSEHKPTSLAHQPDAAVVEEPATVSNTNAECAIVFGTSVGLDMVSAGPVVGDSNIRRYACQSLANADANAFVGIQPEEIPPTLEGYASVPLPRPKPFQSLADCTSLDGWDISLIDFCVPRADATTSDGQEASLFGVSLVLRRSRAKPCLRPQQNAKTECVVSSAVNVQIKEENGHLVQTVPVKSECRLLNEKLAGMNWTERVLQEVPGEDQALTVGLALVSCRNVVFAMRETLSRFLDSLSRSVGQEGRSCQTLVDILGAFSYQNVEENALRSLLDYHLLAASQPWLERPIYAQREDFVRQSCDRLIKNLPPIPLALFFITALLEQKIVLSSSRRSVLMSATTVLGDLLKPLKWCHLLVPRVPASLASDLIQYPAPFILGIPSEEDGIMELIRDLPEDVTLVDLDVGRVILAPSFAHNSEFGRGTPNNSETSRALRSQVLYLAQSLGGVFGAAIDPESWSCDSPPGDSRKETSFERLAGVCSDFVQELVAGTTASCYWVEESGTPGAEATVLFDEDRFFNIKNLRKSNNFQPLFHARDKSNSLALALEDFDLIIEIFLRCQSLNYFISTTRKEKMVFAP